MGAATDGGWWGPNERFGGRESLASAMRDAGGGS
jgi:hypothetical protein